MQISRHFRIESKNFNIFLCKPIDIIPGDIKEMHVMKIVSQLIEANIVDNGGLFAVGINFFDAGCFNIPKAENRIECSFRLSFFYFVLLVNAFDKAGFPPFDVSPNFMRFYAILEIYLFPFFVYEVVSEWQHHELLGVVGIKLIRTLW